MQVTAKEPQPFARYVHLVLALKTQPNEEPEGPRRQPLGRDPETINPARAIVEAFMADGRHHTASDIGRAHPGTTRDVIRSELKRGVRLKIYDRDGNGDYWKVKP